MKFWVGVTDNKWYQFLSQLRPRSDEVNFWQPSGTPPFKGAPIGLPFLFKLKRPYNHIAGGGFFVTYSSLPLSLAWEVFGHKNGCSSLDEFRALIAPLTADRRSDGPVGCNVLANPFFSRCHFVFAQAVFLERIVGGIDLHRPEGDNFPFKHETDVIPLRSLLEPVTESAPAFRDC